MGDGSYQALLKRVAENVKKARNRLGLTQEQAAAKGDFNYRYYQKLEGGRQSINLATLYRVAKALKADVREFFD